MNDEILKIGEQKRKKVKEKERRKSERTFIRKKKKKEKENLKNGERWRKLQKVYVKIELWYFYKETFFSENYLKGKREGEREERGKDMKNGIE